MKTTRKRTAGTKHGTKALQDELSQLSTLVSKALTRVLSSIEKGEFKKVISGTGEREKITQLESRIEERCIRILVQEKGQTPFLRWVTRAIIIISLLEGAYQQIIMVMEGILSLKKKGRTSLQNEVISMARISRGMLRESMKSFLTMNEDRARKVLREDTNLDHHKEVFLERAFGLMINRPEGLRETMRWILLSKHLERIGDHASQIAEEVLFLAKE